MQKTTNDDNRRKAQQCSYDEHCPQVWPFNFRSHSLFICEGVLPREHSEAATLLEFLQARPPRITSRCVSIKTSYRILAGVWTQSKQYVQATALQGKSFAS